MTLACGEHVRSPGGSSHVEFSYNPDNGVTRNFMPHLWMFLLQSLTPPGHEVLLIDGNAKPMDEAQTPLQYVRDGKDRPGRHWRDDRHDCESLSHCRRNSGHGRESGDGRPSGRSSSADQALGRDGGPRHADAVALGEADETWPQMVNDAARGELKEIYTPVDETGKERSSAASTGLQLIILMFQSVQRVR